MSWGVCQEREEGGVCRRRDVKFNVPDNLGVICDQTEKGLRGLGSIAIFRF